MRLPNRPSGDRPQSRAGNSTPLRKSPRRISRDRRISGAFLSDFRRYSSCTKARNARASRPRASPHADDQRQSKGANDARFEGSSGSRRPRSRRGVRSPGSCSAQQSRQVTFSKDVAPIFQARCQSCHEPGSIAPDVAGHVPGCAAWARSIKHARHRARCRRGTSTAASASRSSRTTCR